MKEASTSEQPTVEQQPVDQQIDEQQADEQRTSLLALSRRSRRAAERETAERETPVTDHSEQETEGSGRDGSQQSAGFGHWYRQRPFIGGVLVVLGGIELFFSGQLDLGNMKIQFGIEGLQATIIPIALVLLGVFATLRPTHHMFYGLIALALAVYSLIGVNLGGFIIGMLLASIGSVLVVAWMGPREPKPKVNKSRSKKSRAKKAEAEASGAERREAGETAGEERNL
ncbi:DUF6114 domain-containing protein [Brevibacterium marinum]|uniref:Putative membrane protein n=1 Tax=Brevibacterium marinum TaxID=418643 RepID=A0A846RP47_9MICO|nr:DUF6114 domain-containing protein [Brevibacterium marinum]NJC55519.1 putative membrane protein [Brevibacterium marinum]